MKIQVSFNWHTHFITAQHQMHCPLRVAGFWKELITADLYAVVLKVLSSTKKRFKKKILMFNHLTK